MTTYYLIDARHITYREFRRMMPNFLLFLIIALLKFLRVPISNGALVPLIDQLHELDWDDIPDEARGPLAGPVAEWERLGFRRVFAVRLPNPQKNRFLVAVLLLSPDPTAHAHLTYVRRPDGTFVWAGVYSLFRDGALGLTTTQKHELDDPPTVFRSQQPAGLPAAEVWERHRENLAGPWAESEVETLGPDGVRAVTLEVERREVAFHEARGILVPATDEDYDRLADPD